MYNFYYRHGDVAVLAIPRCASESLASGPHLLGKEAAQFEVLAFVRDPIDRAVSGYWMFERFPQEPRHAASYEAYVDRILNPTKGADYLSQEKDAGRIKGEPAKIVIVDGVRHVEPMIVIDPHWLPQSTLIDEAPIPVTQVWLFESLNDVIKGLPHVHQTQRRVVVDASYRLAELEVYYAADIQLRKSALGV